MTEHLLSTLGAAPRNISPNPLAIWKLTRVANRQNHPMSKGL